MIEDDWPLTVTPATSLAIQPKLRLTTSAKHHGDQRDPQEQRAAVDHRQQEEHERERRDQQRAVDVVEDLDAVGRVAGGARDLDLEAAAGVADAVAHVRDGIEDRVALAVRSRCRRAAAPRCRPARSAARRTAASRQLQAVELRAVGGDPWPCRPRSARRRGGTRRRSSRSPSPGSASSRRAPSSTRRSPAGTTRSRSSRRPRTSRAGSPPEKAKTVMIQMASTTHFARGPVEIVRSFFIGASR